MKIYISIPISGRDIDEQKRKAKEVEDIIRELGHDPVNPLTVALV